ncbi:unnamed protein product [Mytilus coruscus]|uniref:Mutator-like transposase domain-containing protein n=1 Tax=Mytilus coruscus TaxID=42192 RepID=A0A6J8D132_MYTCO|nr:unnamed protein product [Mytilus coruscus]
MPPISKAPQSIVQMPPISKAPGSIVTMPPISAPRSIVTMPPISQVTRIYCNNAIHLEHQNLLQTGDDQLSVSVDAGWQKRGSGKAYDSLSEHCSMIGKYTCKITNYKVRSRSCRMCSSASSRNETAEDHDCKKNWDGSAKAMEQDMTVEMVSECNEKGFKTGTVIGDDDSTTMYCSKTETSCRC